MTPAFMDIATQELNDMVTFMLQDIGCNISTEKNVKIRLDNILETEMVLQQRNR